MNQFVESLKRLYDGNKINEAKVASLCNEGKITISDKQYILGR